MNSMMHRFDSILWRAYRNQEVYQYFHKLIRIKEGIQGTSITGAAGSPGTVILPVQFCDGTPSYPSTFPEVGFCLDGKLYAVYSTNGGFMTEIPPGRYESNAVGSRCDFTVGEDCTVTRD